MIVVMCPRDAPRAGLRAGGPAPVGGAARTMDWSGSWCAWVSSERCMATAGPVTRWNRGCTVRTEALGPGSCQAVASRPPGRGCHSAKRGFSVTSDFRWCGRADALGSAAHAGRCTRSAGLPSGRSCRPWNRRTAVAVTSRMLLTWFVCVGGTSSDALLTRGTGGPAVPTLAIASALSLAAALAAYAMVVTTAVLGSGSCEAAASHPHGRGCRPAKRRSSVTADSCWRGRAEAEGPMTHAGRCTRSASPPPGGGCWPRNRCVVGFGFLLRLVTSFACGRASTSPTPLLWGAGTLTVPTALPTWTRSRPVPLRLLPVTSALPPSTLAEAPYQFITISCPSMPGILAASGPTVPTRRLT